MYILNILVPLISVHEYSDNKYFPKCDLAIIFSIVQKAVHMPYVKLKFIAQYKYFPVDKFQNDVSMLTMWYIYSLTYHVFFCLFISLHKSTISFPRYACGFIS
jgi:hypothetical protein